MKKYLALLVVILGIGRTASAQTKKIAVVFNAIHNKYVDSTNVEELTDAAIKGMLATLDPHSVYIPASEVAATNAQLKDHFVGIGVMLGVFNDSLLVLRVIPDGPAERAGIQVGDRIVAVNKLDIAQLDLDKQISLIHGIEGSSVDIKVNRAGILSSVKIARNKLPNPAIDAAYLIDSITGYIHIHIFASNTTNEFRDAISNLKQLGMKQLILDLRDNLGGLFEEGIQLTNQFFPADVLITSTKGEHVRTKDYYSRPGGIFQQGKMAVLINENTASASEVCTGALQDWKRAEVIGRRSFGKGLVQYPITLPDKSVIRLTGARYYTPKGKCIQKPYTNYENEVQDRIRHRELVNPDSMLNDGGIKPDLFVPIDSILLTEEFKSLFKNKQLGESMIQYYLEHVLEIRSNYPNYEIFSNYFQFPDKLFQFVLPTDSLNKNEIIKIDDQERIKNIVSLRMKAQVAEYLWGREALLKMNNTGSPELNAALQYLYKKE